MYTVFPRAKPEGIHLTAQVVQTHTPLRAMVQVTCTCTCTLIHVLCCLLQACQHMTAVDACSCLQLPSELPYIKEICTAEGDRVCTTLAPLPKLTLPKSMHLGKQMYPSGCALRIHLSALMLRAGPYQPDSMGFKPWAVPLMHPRIGVHVRMYVHCMYSVHTFC